LESAARQRETIPNGVSPVLNQIVSGWTLDTIATFSKGNQFTVLAVSSTSMDPMTQYRAYQFCDGRSTLKQRKTQVTAAEITSAGTNCGDHNANACAGRRHFKQQIVWGGFRQRLLPRAEATAFSTS
jgi:hypothetical protein